MADLVVRPVESRSEQRRFIRLPWNVYRGDPNWVPPLIHSQKRLLGFLPHPFYREAEARSFIARRGGTDVGRITAIVNQAHNRRHGEHRGFFGFFECHDDAAAARALFGTARDWLASRGMTCIRGPANPSLNYEAGLLVDAFDKPPTFMTTYNPAWYPALVEANGFAKVQDMYAYWGEVPMLARLDPKIGQMCKAVVDRFDVKLRRLDASRFEDEVRLYFDIYNGSMQATWGFVPFSEAEILHLAGELRHLIVRDLAIVAEVDGRPVGTTFALLDFNPRVRRIDGRLLPFGLFRLLWNKRAIRHARLVTANVVPEFQAWGIGLALLAALIHRCSRGASKRRSSPGSWRATTCRGPASSGAGRSVRKPGGCTRTIRRPPEPRPRSSGNTAGACANMGPGRIPRCPCADRRGGNVPMKQESAAAAPLGPARYVVIGGGAMGCGAAYALAKAGHTDVLVLEKQPNLCEVTSSQGAGLCGQVRSSVERTRLAMFSARTFAELQAAGGPATPGWHPVGSLRLAHTEARAADLARLEAVCRDAGLEVELLDAARARRLWPRLTFAGIRGALWCPSDGYMHPQSVVATYVHHARESGVRFATNVVVLGIELCNGRVAAVRTNRGTIECGNVVNAAGAHAYHVARMVGLELPIVPVRHEYFVSLPMSGLHPELPVVRIPDIGLYLRAEGQGVLAGGFEDDPCSKSPTDFGVTDEPAVPGVEDVAGDFARRLEPLLPGVSGLPVTRFAKGWPTFTPDGRFIVGPSSRVPGFIMAGGCQAHGISGSPGLGRHLVEALFGEEASPYVRSLSPDRFEGRPWDWPAARRAAEKVYREYYAIGP